MAAEEEASLAQFAPGVPSWRASGRVWWTAVVLLLALLWQVLRTISSRRRLRLMASLPAPDARSTRAREGISSSGISKIITDEDMKKLMANLEGDLNGGEKWEDVIDKKNDRVSYAAKCCRSKDGPLKYLSTTVFENCSADMLREFYMDNDYRKEWDRTVVDHQQLEVDEASGTEVGRTIKKFPLLALREYVLAWREWQGEDGAFYCFIKECDHPSAPRQKKYVRVGLFRSGWRIRKVAGRDASEITMVHQEDAGLNAELARMAFAKGIWSYVGKMNGALRDYSLRGRPSSIRPLQLPPGVEEKGAAVAAPGPPYQSSSSGGADYPAEEGKETLWRKPSKTWIAKGLLLAGGIVCLSRGHSTLGAQIAVACVLKKLVNKQGEASGQGGPARLSRGRRGHRHRA